MCNRALFCILSGLFVGCLLFPAFAEAQDTTPYVETGLKPFGAYAQGKIDNINLLTGQMSLDIPLISYPQRGGKLRLSFHLHYVNVGAATEPVCIDEGPAGVVCFLVSYVPSNWCGPIDVAGEILCHGFHFFDQDLLTFTHGQGGSGGSNMPTSDSAQSVVIFKPDGGSYGMDPISGDSTSTVWESPVVGYQFTANNGNLTNGTIVDEAGTKYTEVNNVEVSRQDTNGNLITFSSSGGWTDSTGRSAIPPVPSTTSDVSNCPQPPNVPQIPSSSATWTPPGVSGGTYPITFCYIQLTETNPEGVSTDGGSTWQPYSYTATELQSVVLPNGMSWTFEYTADGLADLEEVIFPTGGSLSYTWGVYNMNPNTGPVDTRVVLSRTMNPNDGTTPAMWTYAYSNDANGPNFAATTVSSPPSSGTTPNVVVHTFSEINSLLPNYETETQYYQGAQSTGSLLKTRNIQYTCVGTLKVCMPTQDTVVWPNGQQVKTVSTYDSALSVYEPYFNNSTNSLDTSTQKLTGSYGKLVTKKGYDYTGSLLRTTTTSWLALSNSNYLNANLLDLPTSVQITGSGPTSITTYGYDATGCSSGVCGNQTTVGRYLSTTGTYLTTTNVYGSGGLITSTSDPKGNPTTFDYSGSGCPSGTGYAGSGPTKVTNALGQATTNCYDLNTGLLTLTTDPNGLATSYAYDDMLRTTQINHPDGGQTNFTYPDATDVDISERITSSTNRLSYLKVDGVGREIRQAVTNGESLPYDETDTCYDGNGNVSFKSYPFQDSEPFAMARSCGSPELGDSFAYDALGRTATVTHSDGSTISTVYSGNSTKVTDEAGKARESFTDGLGRLTEVIEDPGSSPHFNYVTNYTYDELDDLTGVAQSNSRQRSFVYDSLSRLTSATNPESGITTYTYDADGNVATKTDARNITTTYGYDALNRVTSKGYSDGTHSVAYAYDQSNCLQLTVTCYNIGHRTSMTDAPGSEEWSYGINPGVGWETEDQRTTNNLTKYSLYEDDLLGSPMSIHYPGSQFPGGRTIDYTPNAGDLPVSAVDASTSVNYANPVHYWANGSPCWEDYGSAITSAETLNSRQQPLEMQANAGVITYQGECPGLGQTGNLLDLSYNFNFGSGDNGNVIGITNNRDTTRSQSFAYDALNRIITGETTSMYSTSPSHCWGEAFFYDNNSTAGGAWGNLTTIGVANLSYNGCTQESLSQSVTANNRILGFCYDAAGNLLGESACPASTYAYNAENQLTSTAGVSYTYDGDGKRVEKSNGTLYWYGLDGNVLDETDLSGNVTNEYVYLGGRRIARLDTSGNAFYYVPDELGTSRVIAEVPSGSTTATLCYDADFYPFGGERHYTDSCDSHYKLTGKERDSESNLDNFGARYFTSSLGRFMSPDPSSALVLKAINPQRWNGYAYGLNSPLSYTDPTGEDAAAVNFEGMVGGQGHEALLIVDRDGTTTFASFGPTGHGISNWFGANGKGFLTVAQDTSTGTSLLPTVQFRANGLPTPESYKALVTALAKIEGVDPSTVRLNYFKTSEADTQNLKAWVDQQRNLVNNLGTGSGFCWYNVAFSNCADFTVAGLFEGNALSQSQIQSLSRGFRPNSLYNELQPFENDEFDLLELQLKQHWCVSAGGQTQCGYD